MNDFSDINSLSSLLKQLGLSDEQASIYNAMLELPQSSIRKIADASNLNRGSVYEALKELVSLGLVRHHQKGQRIAYTAEKPEKIFELIKDKRKTLLQAQASAEKIVPMLKTRFARQDGAPLVRYYEDDEGVVAILKDVLSTSALLEPAQYYVYSSAPIRQYLYRKFPSFTDRRIDEGIHVKVIAIGEGGDKMPSSERKWMSDRDDHRATSYILIYGNKVASISISADDTPYGVVIEDSGVASMQKLLFEQVWDSL